MKLDRILAACRQTPKRAEFRSNWHVASRSRIAITALLSIRPFLVEDLQHRVNTERNRSRGSLRQRLPAALRKEQGAVNGM